MAQPHLGTVLVTGAFGRVGKVCTALLAKSGRVTVRAAALNEEEAEVIKKLGAHEIVTWNLTEKSTWAAATKGVSRVFSSTDVPFIEEHKEFAKHLASLGDQIKHVVRISCFGADTNTNSYDHDKHVSSDSEKIPYQLVQLWLGEEALIKAGLPVTGIRGNFYMNHLLKQEVPNIKDHQFFTMPLANCKNSFVCPSDQGEAGAVCLLEGPEKHANKFYDITGPEAHSMYEVAEILSQVWGKKVQYVPCDPAEWEREWGYVRASFRSYLRNGFYTRCSPDFYNLTGRKPTSYLEYMTTKGPHNETGLEELFTYGLKAQTKGVDLYAGKQ